MVADAESYSDLNRIAAEVEAGLHREVVGGMWEEIGAAQLAFLSKRGLKPEHRLLDIGCGSLRAGVHFVDFLEPGHYFGLDSSEALIEAGYSRELAALGLTEKLPRSNLVTSGDFDTSGWDVKFDFAIAQSVFTHLPFNRIRACLERLAPSMRCDGEFYATYFVTPDDHPWESPFTHTPGGIVTTGVSDPYHYRLADLSNACRSGEWDCEFLGDWGHPRSQNMMLYRRRC
jgi:SAM-dependent methyltransferase